MPKTRKPRVFGFEFSEDIVREVAEMQKTYSHLLLDGVIDAELFISVTIILTLRMFGMNYDNTAELHHDMQCVHDAARALRKLKERLDTDA